MNIRLLALCAVVALIGSQTALAQAQAPAVLSYVGEPFSGLRTGQAGRNFVDGNRIDRGTSEQLYRDGQGRTRVERAIPAPMQANNAPAERLQVIINDPVSGDRIELLTATKKAIIFHGDASPALPPPAAAPGVFVTFARHLYTANDPGWSKAIPLGEKSFDGVRATGQRRQYTIPVGEISNEKPIVLTVDQWYSPELSLIVSKSATSSLGGEFSNQVENIVHREPDPSLFLIPSDYTRIEAPRRQATVH